MSMFIFIFVVTSVCFFSKKRNMSNHFKFTQLSLLFSTLDLSSVYPQAVYGLAVIRLDLCFLVDIDDLDAREIRVPNVSTTLLRSASPPPAVLEKRAW